MTIEALKATARVKINADEQYRKAFNSFMAELDELEDTELFWRITDILAEAFKGKRTPPTESAVHNLFHACLWSNRVVEGIYQTSELAAWSQMAQYCISLRELKRALSTKLWDLPGLERGDDGYGDLIDCLPLAGRKVIEGIFEDDIANYKQLAKAVSDHPLGDSFFLYGEHYIDMGLEEKVKDAFCSILRSLDIKAAEEARYA
jgi:hypothetical protein